MPPSPARIPTHLTLDNVIQAGVRPPPGLERPQVPGQPVADPQHPGVHLTGMTGNNKLDREPDTPVETAMTPTRPELPGPTYAQPRTRTSR